MENNPKIRLETNKDTSLDNKDDLHYKMLVQDAYNEFSAIERLASLSALSDEDFFKKIEGYDIKKFDEYYQDKGMEYNSDKVDELYPGYVAQFNRLVEKIKNKDISRSEIMSELKELYSETTESIAA